MDKKFSKEEYYERKKEYYERLEKQRQIEKRYEIEKSVVRSFNIIPFLMIFGVVAIFLNNVTVHNDIITIGNLDCNYYYVSASDTLLIGSSLYDFVLSLFISISNIGNSVSNLIVKGNGLFNDAIFDMLSFATVNIVNLLNRIVQGITYIIDCIQLVVDKLVAIFGWISK